MARYLDMLQTLTSVSGLSHEAFAALLGLCFTVGVMLAKGAYEHDPGPARRLSWMHFFIVRPFRTYAV